MSAPRRLPITKGATASDNAARRSPVIDKTAAPKRPHPAERAAALQRRVRGLTDKLKRGEAYHVELDAIASELGVLSMDLESYDPTCHAFRSPRTAPPSPAGRSEHIIREHTAASVFRTLK